MEFKYQIVYTMQYFDDFNNIADYYRKIQKQGFDS